MPQHLKQSFLYIPFFYKIGTHNRSTFLLKRNALSIRVHTRTVVASIQQILSNLRFS